MITCEARERAKLVADAIKAKVQAGPDGKALAELVLEAVRAIRADELNPPITSESSPAFQPRAVLAMLTYCYANRVYGSYDIEQMMQEDAAFRALCGREYPDGRQLRRFRRHNHALLQRTLAETLRRTAGKLEQGPVASSTGKTSDNGLGDSAISDAVLQDAEARIEQAMFIDQMTMEN